MKNKSKKIIISMLVLSLLAGCGASAQTVSSTSSESEASESEFVQTDSETVEVIVDNDEMYFSSRDSKTEYDSDIKVIDLSQVEDLLEITEKGEYKLIGTLEGQIKINASDEKVRLVLDEVSIINNQGAAIYVEDADKVFITTAKDTVNIIRSTISQDDAINAAIYSKDDLTLNGLGILNVESDGGHGIKSSDELTISNGTYVVIADNNGLRGNDSVAIKEAGLNITSGTDAVHSENNDDETKGIVYISSGDIEINAQDDGIKASNRITVLSGKINITNSYEGIEAKIVNIIGGDIDIIASDDGINTSDGSTKNEEAAGNFTGQRPDGPPPEWDGNGEPPARDDRDRKRPMGGAMITGDISQDGVRINISGGDIHVNAMGDGIDSNGDIYMSGGLLYISGPTTDRDGTIDKNGQFIITGGSIMGSGSSGMMEKSSEESSQPLFAYTTGKNYEANTAIVVKDSEGNEIANYLSEKTFSAIVVSNDKIEVGQTYTIQIENDTYQVTQETMAYSNGVERGHR